MIASYGTLLQHMGHCQIFKVLWKASHLISDSDNTPLLETLAPKPMNVTTTGSTFVANTKKEPIHS